MVLGIYSCSVLFLVEKSSVRSIPRGPKEGQATLSRLFRIFFFAQDSSGFFTYQIFTPHLAIVDPNGEARGEAARGRELVCEGLLELLNVVLGVISLRVGQWWTYV